MVKSSCEKKNYYYNRMVLIFPGKAERIKKGSSCEAAIDAQI
jgi:hypothetical protein